VLTKEDVPFLSNKNGDNTVEDVYSWMYSIPPDRRDSEIRQFDIKK
jgi:hypothetical protein